MYLSIIFFVGLKTRKYINSFSDFMVANRSVSLSLGVVTMLGTELGLITVMYNAEKGVTDLFSSFHITVVRQRPPYAVAGKRIDTVFNVIGKYI